MFVHTRGQAGGHAKPAPCRGPRSTRANGGPEQVGHLRDFDVALLRHAALFNAGPSLYDGLCRRVLVVLGLDTDQTRRIARTNAQNCIERCSIAEPSFVASARRPFETDIHRGVRRTESREPAACYSGRQRWIRPQRAEQVEAHRHRREQIGIEASLVECLMALGVPEAVSDGAQHRIVDEVDAVLPCELLLDAASDRPETAALLCASSLSAGRPSVLFPPTILVSAGRPSPGGDVGLTRHSVDRFVFRTQRHRAHFRMPTCHGCYVPVDAAAEHDWSDLEGRRGTKCRRLVQVSRNSSGGRGIVVVVNGELTVDEDAPTNDFAAFYEGSRDDAMALAWLLTHDTAVCEDVVHDAYAAVLVRFDSVEQPAAYLRKVIVNGVYPRARGTRREQRRLELVAVTSPNTAEGPTGGLADAVAALPIKPRTIVVLRYWAGLTDVIRRGSDAVLSFAQPIDRIVGARSHVGSRASSMWVHPRRRISWSFRGSPAGPGEQIGLHVGTARVVAEDRRSARGASGAFLLIRRVGRSGSQQGRSIAVDHAARPSGAGSGARRGRGRAGRSIRSGPGRRRPARPVRHP